MKLILSVVSELIRQRWMVWSLAWRDFRHRYVRNLFGIVWAVIDPIVFVGILYLIFNSGIGSANTDDVPFIVYILCGNIAFDLFKRFGLLLLKRKVLLLFFVVVYLVCLLPTLKQPMLWMMVRQQGY